MTFSKREVSIGEVCEIKQGRYLAPNQMEQNPTEDSPVPVIGGNGVLGYTTQSTFSFPVPLVTCRGSKCGLMQWAEPPTWISNNAMAVYFKDGEGDNFFLHQYLLNLSFEDVTTGSAQPQITVTNLSSKRLSLPDLETQTAISKILKNIEGKITINNALSKTLEDIAQTIFKSWFIDLDPVKAKMNGEKPIGMDDESAALFPDSFEESELGLIPKGWKSGSLGDLFELQGGFAFKSSSWTDTGVPVIKIGSVKPGFIDFGQVSYVSEEFANEIPDDYRLTAGSLVVGLTGYVGEVGLARSHFPVPLINQRVAKFKSKSEEWKLPFIYCVTRNPKFKATVEELATGTAQQNVSNAQILSIPIVKPTKEVLTYFEDMLNSYFEQIINLADENETLKSLRDSLLPRLISGELQIPEEMLAS
jgi:type I restriction enzyme S subunit